MTIPPSAQAFWNTYQVSVGADLSARFYESFYFADSERSANARAELVLVGTKRATAALVWSLEAAKKPAPKPGDLSIMTNWQGEPLCIIRTKIVEIAPFEEVTEAFAAIEGEGDKSLRYWREAHWAYFGRECERLGRIPSMAMPILCEQFEVVYQRPGENAA